MTHPGAHPIDACSVTEHRARILSIISSLPPVDVPLAEALDRILATDVFASVDVPSFDNSAMDGYAVRFADAAMASAARPVTLRVVADLPAGSADDPSLGAGEAARIMTGAAVPTDADCIVPVEHTDGATDTVQIFRAPAPAAHIRRTGTDVRRGALVLGTGRRLTSRDLSAAAAVGAGTLSVYPAPRVGVLSTGSELRIPGATLTRGQIHDSNSTLLAAAVHECGGVPVQLGSVADDEGSFELILENAAGHVDAIVTSGGVSVGAYDIVKAVLAPLGVWFGPVRMQPGKPQVFGEFVSSDASGARGVPIFTLPGNPVSVFVSFEQFVRPAILAMQGQEAALRRVHRGVVSQGWHSPADREQFIPVIATQRADGAFDVSPASSGGSGSYLVASLAGANALAIVPEQETEVRSGDDVEVTLLG